MKMGLLFLIGLMILTGCNEKKVELSEIDVQFEDDKMIHFYKNERFSGIIFENWDNDNPEYLMEVDDGLLDGSYKEFFENGELSMEVTYVNGLKDGVEIHYEYDGEVFVIKRYKNDLLHGPYEVYHSNGNLRLKSNYRNGLQHGSHTEYNRDGEIEVQTTYNRGVELIE